MFVVVQTNTTYPNGIDEDDNTNFQPLKLSIGAFQLHGVPRPPKNPGANVTHNFGVGSIQEAWYTVANCHIQRAPGRTHNDLNETQELNIAYPVRNFLDASFSSCNK